MFLKVNRHQEIKLLFESKTFEQVCKIIRTDELDLKVYNFRSTRRIGFPSKLVPMASRELYCGLKREEIKQ